jgi:hypothetical protein
MSAIIRLKSGRSNVSPLKVSLPVLPDVSRSLFAQVVAHPFAAYGFPFPQGLRSWRCSQYSVVKVRVANIQRIPLTTTGAGCASTMCSFQGSPEGCQPFVIQKEKSGVWSGRVPASPDFL